MRLRPYVIALILLVPASPAVAQQAEVAPERPDRITIIGRDDGEADAQQRRGRSRSRNSDDRDLVRVRDIAYGTNDDGERCIRIISVWVDAEDAPLEDSENVRILRMADRYPLCPDSDPLPRVPAPNVLADQLWEEEVDLSQPRPLIEPADAITGIPVYLQIRGPQTGRWTFEPFGIEIVIEATSEYIVDWGDGTPTTRTRSQGGPYPEGDITHGYQWKGTYDIVVTQRWTATWRASGAGTNTSGTIADVLQTVGTIEDFSVTEVQAVRER